MVPILIVACRAIISGVKGVRDLTSSLSGSVWSGRIGRITAGAGSLCEEVLRADLTGLSPISSILSSKSFRASKLGDPGPESESESRSFPYLSPFAAILGGKAAVISNCFKCSPLAG